MAPLFPAVLIGGPPHSGKSTLTYRLSNALRQQGIVHYALRASPDGEGDWSSEAQQDLVARLRVRAKTDWTPAFADAMSRDIAGRHLPLLVDAGGQVSPEMEQIAAQCTHALLIAANPAGLAPWRDLAARHGLPLIADLQSDLHGMQRIDADGPTLTGAINGLERGLQSAGPCFDALVARLAHLLAYDENELYRTHLTMTDIELVIHVERPIHPLPAHNAGTHWKPEELPVLLESLPRDEALGIYGRGPVWLYAALAACNTPQRCAVFDVRQGWIEPPVLRPGAEADRSCLRWDAVTAHAGYTHIQLSIPGGYLDYREAKDLPVPIVPHERGVVIDGKLPNWLWAALARTYTNTNRWIGVFQPKLNEAIIVFWQNDATQIGKTIPITPADAV